MKVRLLQTALSLSLTGALALMGCDGGGDDTTDDITKPPADSGVIPDAGDTDSGVTPDSGMPDTGMRDDAGTVDPCPDGEEGCECSSTLQPDGTAFLQDDCDSGLLCIPWDIVTGRQDDVIGPVHSCVQPCTADADCGSGRFCRNMGFTPESGAEMFCVDEEAEVDQFCGGSRLSVSKLPGDMGMVPYQTAGTIVGCPTGTDCTIGVFGDVHPDEGICLNLCTEQADCGGDYPNCNLIFQSQTSTEASGVCSGEIRGIGAACGAGRGVFDADKVGLTERCDASVEGMGCFGVDGLFPSGVGFCAQPCDNATPCTESEAGIGNYTCTAAPGAMMGEGFCTIDCSNFPENCEGQGTYDAGRMCYEGLAFVPQMGDPIPLPFCMDRLSPALDITVLTPDAMAIASQGGNCEDPADMLSFMKCPEGTFCEIVMQNQLGVCLAGCVRSSTTPAGMQGGCEILGTQTATCAPYYVDMDGNPVSIGACGDM